MKLIIKFKRIIKSKYVLVTLFSITSCYNQETIVDKNKLVGSDYRLYQNTLAWELAKAVRDEDTNKIKDEIKKGVPVNFQESIFGNNLLIMAISNNDFESVKVLLKLGASPNLRDNYTGSNAVIEASRNDDPKYLKIILEYKGDPNSLENEPLNSKNGIKNSLRVNAIGEAIELSGNNSLEKVKLLVEAGANLNYYKEGPILPITELPLSRALMLVRLDIALYLLENGADYKRPIYTMNGNNEIYILQALRKCILDLDSKQYRKKMEIVTFLKGKGLNYNLEPIPKQTLERIKEIYPNSWEEYISKY